MRRFPYLVLLAVAVVMWPFVAGAVDLVGSPHDLSSSTVDTDEVCIFCHAPHKGQHATRRPLWNHELTVSTLTWTPTTTTRGTTLPTSTSTGNELAGSRACLSCHDGTVGVGNVLVWWDSGNNQSTTKNFTMTGSIFTTNQLNNTSSAYFNPAAFGGNHPIGVKSPSTSQAGFTTFTTLNGATTSDANGVDYDANGYVQCQSCHNPHLYDANITYGPFLRKTNQNSALCTTCHNL